MTEINGDGRQDLVVDPSESKVQVWFGGGAHGPLTAGPRSPQRDSQMLVVDRRLYRRSPGPGGIGIQIQEIDREGRFHDLFWQPLASYAPNATIQQFWMAPLAFDLDGNERLDDIAVLSVERGDEGPHQAAMTFVSPTQITTPVSVPTPFDVEDRFTIAGVFPSRSAAQPKDELVCILTSGVQTPVASLTIVNVGADQAQRPEPRSTFTLPSIPDLRRPYAAHEVRGVSYGRFAPSRHFAAPVLQFAAGPSMILHPVVDAPYVTRWGAWMPTGPKHLYLPEAVADYDGDGEDEMIVLETLGEGERERIWLLDPHPGMHNVRALTIPRRGSVVHARAADLDGDGRPELVLSRTGATSTPLTSLLQVVQFAEDVRLPATTEAGTAR